jgi:hypothetical protein
MTLPLSVSAENRRVHPNRDFVIYIPVIPII